MDGDGDLDALFNDRFAIRWQENTDGPSRFWPQRVITVSRQGGADVYPADLDGDGDLDVLAASQNAIGWHQNVDGKGHFAEYQLITDSVTGIRSVNAADLDEDGDLDVLSASQVDGKIAWYRNDGVGRFGAQQLIMIDRNASSVDAADLDGDGDVDVLSSVSGSLLGRGNVSWYKNEGNGAFGSQQAIGRGGGSVQTADLDADGDQDLLIAGGELAWFQNLDGQGQFGEAKPLAESPPGARSVMPADVDGDGDLDVLAAWLDDGADGEFSWFENTDGTGRFGERQPFSEGFERSLSITAGDLDGDGDVDALTSWSDVDSNRTGKITWHENTDGRGRFSERKFVTSAADRPTSLDVSDLDGDGDLDVLSGATFDVQLAWHSNIDGSGHLDPRQAVARDAGPVNSVVAADLDLDGDQDVLYASDSTLGWYANLGGGEFGPQQVLGDESNDVLAADLDGDGDLDVVAAVRRNDGEVVWHENHDGRGSFSLAKRITTMGFVQTVNATDVDGDGDLDIIAGSFFRLSWFENLDGRGTFGDEQLIVDEEATAVFAADLDGDGDRDVLLASFGDFRVAWYENTDGQGSFGARRRITNDARGATSVFAADLDGDGDLDVLASSYYDNSVSWFENTDGRGRFGEQQLITTEALGANDVIAADLDRDGDLDVLSTSRNDAKIAWYESRQIGDSSDDGLFNSTDLVTVFQIGKYDDGIPGNATFDDGDWNQDGDFDSGDVVFAFQRGNYVSAARPSASPIAAAVDRLFSERYDAKRPRGFVA